MGHVLAALAEIGGRRFRGDMTGPRNPTRPNLAPGNLKKMRSLGNMRLPALDPMQRWQKLLAARLAKKTVSAHLSRPMISITFDDFPQSAVTVAGKILADHGVRGTYYASMGLMGQTTEVGKLFDIKDLREAVKAGHEVACHTLDHAPCGSLSRTELLRRCKQNRRLAAEALGGYEFRNFSFPFGEVTLAAKAALSAVYDTCRSIQPGINRDEIDLAYLRANRVYSGLPIENVLRVIEENVGEKGWVILYTHDVTDHPSPYGCTPEFFENALRAALESGAEIVTVAEGCCRLRSRHGSDEVTPH
jgi:peptidoglycan/xylan/chitin deacetylase (PgdA/CDA1 family)